MLRSNLNLVNFLPNFSCFFSNMKEQQKNMNTTDKTNTKGDLEKGQGKSMQDVCKGFA